MSSGGTYPTMREQIDALEAKLAAAHAAMARISAKAGMPFTPSDVPVTIEEYESKAVYGIGRIWEAKGKMEERHEQKLSDLQAQLDTERELRKAAETNIAAIPAICRGEPVACALPMTESEANELRNVAHEIIIKLWKAKQTTHLDLLKAHCQSAIEEIQKGESK